MSGESIGDRIFRVCITLFLCLVAFVAFIPLISVLAMSFSSKAAADANQVSLLPVDATLASWKYVLTNAALWKSFAITLASAVGGTFLALSITSLIAYPLAKSDYRIGSYIMLGIVVTMIFKAPIVPYFLTVRNLGLYNNPLVLVIPHILSAYNLAIMRTFFKQFPEELEEAAMIEGCGPFRVLFKIVIPSSTAVLATLGLFYAVVMWNQFQHPLMFIQSIDLFPLQLKIRQLIDDDTQLLSSLASFGDINYSTRTLRAATIVFAIMPIVAIYPYLQKYFAKGAMLGSVKG